MAFNFVNLTFGENQKNIVGQGECKFFLTDFNFFDINNKNIVPLRAVFNDNSVESYSLNTIRHLDFCEKPIFSNRKKPTNKLTPSLDASSPQIETFLNIKTNLSQQKSLPKAEVNKCFDDSFKNLETDKDGKTEIPSREAIISKDSSIKASDQEYLKELYIEKKSSGELVLSTPEPETPSAFEVVEMENPVLYEYIPSIKTNNLPTEPFESEDTLVSNINSSLTENVYTPTEMKNFKFTAEKVAYNDSCESRCEDTIYKNTNLDSYAVLSFGESPGLYEDYAGVGFQYSINHFLFGDSAIFYVDNDAYCFSQGIGFHTQTVCRELDFYTFIYYEYMNHKSGSFNQLSLSLNGEWNCFYFDFNAYIPVGETSHCGCTKFYTDYDNTGSSIDYVVSCHTDYIAYQGFDALIGRYLYLPCNFGKVFFGVGPYYLNNCEENDFFGVRAHLDYHYNDYCSFFLRSNYDRENDFLLRFGLEFSFPLYFCSDRSKCNEDIRRTRRDDIIKILKCSTYGTNY